VLTLIRMRSRRASQACARDDQILHTRLQSGGITVQKRGLWCLVRKRAKRVQRPGSSPCHQYLRIGATKEPVQDETVSGACTFRSKASEVPTSPCVGFVCSTEPVRRFLRKDATNDASLSHTTMRAFYQ